MNTWWKNNSERLNNEIQLMGKKFPQFQIGQSNDNKVYHGWTIVRESQKYWLGDLRTRSGSIYKIVISYPDHYPGMELRSFVIDPYINRTDHRYGDGHLCLYSNDHGGRGQGRGNGMTAVSYVAWTAAWLHSYEIYSKTGKWPENNFFNRFN